MNPLDFFTKAYGSLHNYRGVPFWALTPARRIVRGLANWYLPRYLARPQKSRGRTEKGLIVSFTSFPARIDKVWMVVESLKNQTVRPEKIILWLSKEQFSTEESIPASLKRQEDELFKIRMVEGDIRSHKKYYYTIQEYPDNPFITCDDDVFYEPDMIERLLQASKLFPECIVANHTAQLRFDEHGELMPYLKFGNDCKAYCSSDLIQIGVGGVFYPPHCLHDLVGHKDVFMKIAPLADDIWLNVMARLKGTPVVQSRSNVLPLPIASNAPTLCSVNNGAENMNDRQIAQIRHYLRDNDIDDVFSPTCCVKATGGGKIVVSLTSFPARINDVWQVVECMLRQTVLPSEIILWLSKDQFPTEESIPQSLRSRVGEIFHIRMVDRDIRSHKKYLYVAQENPDDLIFIVDDDIYYPTDIIERSLKAYRSHKGDCVVANYGMRIARDVKGDAKPYTQWPTVTDAADGSDIFFGSGGGTLLRPSALHHDLTRIDLAMQLTPLADDIWLNTMARLARVPVILLKNRLILPIRYHTTAALCDVNNGQNMNDKQIAQIRKYLHEQGLPDVYSYTE